MRARLAWEGEREGSGEEGVRRFAAVAADDGAALPAPELPNARLRARPRHRGA